MVHLPAHLDAKTTDVASANYTVYTSNGPVKKKVDQRGTYDRWVVLGEFPFYGKPKVSLTNLMDGPEAPTDVVWDAVAIRPLGGHDSAPPPYMPEIHSVASDGKCLQPISNALNSRVELRTCSVWTANTWITTQVGLIHNGTTPLFRIQDRGTGQCLEMEDHSRAEDAFAHIAPCNMQDDTSQVWLGFPGRNANSNDGEERLRNIHSDKCLEPLFDGTRVLVKQVDCADPTTLPIWALTMS